MMRSKRVILAAIVLGSIIAASAILVFSKGKTYGSVEVSRVVSVYDGDTFRADIDEWPDIVGENIGVRVYGVDTPEMRDNRPEIRRLARKAKRFVIEKLSVARVIELRDIRRGKYFRVVGDVYVDGKSLREMLINEGLAKEYYGGRKPGWP